MKIKLLILLASLTAIMSVYSEPPKPDLEIIQGKWEGSEKSSSAPADGHSYLTITANKLDFIGADTNEWYKGTFTLHENANPKQFIGVIKDCPSSDCVGLTIYAIYRIENGKFTICGSSPGETNFPSSFDAAGTRKIVFARQETSNSAK